MGKFITVKERGGLSRLAEGSGHLICLYLLVDFQRAVLRIRALAKDKRCLPRVLGYPDVHSGTVDGPADFGRGRILGSCLTLSMYFTLIGLPFCA